MNPFKKCSALLLGSVMLAATAHAEQSLEQAASDPTASIMSLQIADWYTSSYHQIDEDSNLINLRVAYPFKIGEQKHIMRMTAPIITDHFALDKGLSDITIFDLATFDESWGRWGVGAVGLLPTGGSKRGAEQWALGPAVGFTARGDGLLWGLFNQNLFTVAGEDDRTAVNVSNFQPILNHSLGDGWSVSLSESQFTYDWENSRWSSLPLGAGVSKLHKFDQLPVQFNLQYEHNFADEVIAAKDTIRFTVKFLLPTL